MVDCTLNELSIVELFSQISKELGVPEPSMDKFVENLGKEFIVKAEQLVGFSTDKLHKELGLPLGIAIKIEEILSRSSPEKPTPGARLRRGRASTSGSQSLPAVNTVSLAYLKYIQLNNTQVKLIQQSWLKISLKSKKFQRYFHNRLAKELPGLNMDELQNIDLNTPKSLQTIIMNLDNHAVAQAAISSFGAGYSGLGILPKHHPAFAKSLYGGITKLTERHASPKDITEEFTATWKLFTENLVHAMFAEAKAESPISAGIRNSRGRSSLQESFSLSSRHNQELSSSPPLSVQFTPLRSSDSLSRRKTDGAHSPRLFRVRSFKKKRRKTFTGEIDVRYLTDAVKDTWNALFPIANEIFTSVFATLNQTETFEFAEHLLVESNVPTFIEYLSEWVTLAENLHGGKRNSSSFKQFKEGIGAVINLPITKLVRDEFVEVVKLVCKKKAKKLNNQTLGEHVRALADSWFRNFEFVTNSHFATFFDTKNICTLKETWNVATANQIQKQSFTTLFHKKLFELGPHIRPLFQNSLETQGKLFTQAISKLFELVDDQIAFRLSLEEMGARHRVYKVPPSAFSIFKEAFLFSLEQSLGNQWNTKVRSAWVGFICVIEEIMSPKMLKPDEEVAAPTLQEIVDTRIYVVSNTSSTELNLCNYKITNFPALPAISHLRQLGLRNNCISVIPPTISLLENLEVLDLSKNKLRSLPSEMKSLTKLQRLYLGNNSLKNLPNEIGFLRDLKILSVASNKLKTLPTSIFLLRNLLSLDISNNRMKIIPWQLYTLTGNLKELTISGNPCKLPNYELPTIKESLFKAYFEGQASSHQFKFALLGCEGAGKTSLLASLKGDTLAAPPLSTDGIDISEWNCGSVQLSCLDFAGQEVYYDNHTLYLSPSAIHVLVFNMTESVQQSLIYWLKTLAAVSPQAPVFLVGTRVDSKDSIVFPGERARDLAIEIGTKQLMGTFEVSCTRGTNIEKLRKSLIRTTTQLAQQLPKVPLNYIRLKEIILSSRSLFSPPILPWNEFVGICEQCSIESVREACNFLQQQGTVMSLVSEDIEKQSTIILDPSWLTELTSSLYSFSHSFGKADGLLSPSQLSQIWRSKKYAEEIHPLLTILLQNFDIILYVDTDKILFPSFLPENPPSSIPTIWLDSSCSENYYRRRFNLPFVPNGFFVRCLIRLLQLGKNSYKIWRSGIYWPQSPINPHQQEVLVLFEPTNSCIDIFISKTNLRLEGAAMHIIIQIIKSSIHSLFHTLNHTTVIPLPSGNIVPVLDIENLILEGKTEFKEKDGTTYPLAELFPDGYISNTSLFTEDDMNKISWKPLSAGSQASVEAGEDSHGDTLACKNFLSGLNSLQEGNNEDRISALHVLQREAWSMLMSDHPNIVKLKGICYSKLCLIMEFAPAGDLYTILHKSQIEYSWDFALRIAMDIATAMESLHDHSPPLLHRDLKSPNILLWSKTENIPEDCAVAKLADLGLMSAALVNHLTQAENPAWTAPEVMKGEAHTCKSDVYSYAMILYEIFFRRFPFSEYNFKFLYQQMDSICKDSCRPSFPNNAPQIVTKLLNLCWHADQDNRLSFTDIRKYLATIIEQKDTFAALRDLQSS